MKRTNEMTKLLTLSAGALGVILSTTVAATALTVTNKSDKDFSIGLDQGAKEKVQTVPAGKSINIKSFCAQDGCGVSGPWGYSVMTKPGDQISYNGKQLTHSNSQASATESSNPRAK